MMDPKHQYTDGEVYVTQTPSTERKTDDRKLIVISVHGEPPTNAELNSISPDWFLITMPRGDWELTAKDEEKLRFNLYNAIYPFTKDGKNGG